MLGHVSQDVVDGYVRKKDGSIDWATHNQVVALLGRPVGPGEMSPAEARRMNDSDRSRGGKRRKVRVEEGNKWGLLI